MEFFNSLGIDIKLLIAQIINFGLLLWVLSKLVYRPIIRRIEKDERLLQEAREQTKRLQQEKDAFARQKAQDIAAVKKQARAIIEEANEIGESIKNQARLEAEQEKEAIIRQIHNRLKEIEDNKNAQTKKNDNS